jgi:DNA-binding response OmpR family regulator
VKVKKYAIIPHTMTHSLLVIETDKNLHKYFKDLFVNHNFFVQVVSDEITAFAYIKKNEPDLIVLDLDSAKPQDQTIYQKIKDQATDIPFVVISNEKNIQLLETMIAPDFGIARPFDDNDLLKLVRTRLGKHKTVESFLTIADLELDSSNMQVKRHGKQIQLTPQEFKLLQYFMSNKGKILTRGMILSRIWMYSSDIKTRVVDVYIGYLRKKIDGEFSKKLLHSVRGYGYVIKE